MQQTEGAQTPVERWRGWVRDGDDSAVFESAGTAWSLQAQQGLAAGSKTTPALQAPAPPFRHGIRGARAERAREEPAREARPARRAAPSPSPGKELESRGGGTPPASARQRSSAARPCPVEARTARTTALLRVENGRAKFEGRRFGGEDHRLDLRDGDGRRGREDHRRLRRLRRLSHGASRWVTAKMVEPILPRGSGEDCEDHRRLSGGSGAGWGGHCV